jgi:5-methylcytosine-specific restriction endonuclease McrA
MDKFEVITLSEARKKQLMFYYTGKPCKEGHLARRYTKVRTCEVCKKKKGVEYRSKNRKILLEKRKKYYQENKDKWQEYEEKNKEILLVKRKRLREKNKEKAKEYASSYYEKNKDRLLAYSKEHRLDNAEKYKEYEYLRRVDKKRYREENKARYRSHCVERRANKLNLTPPLSEIDVLKIEDLYSEAREVSKKTGIKHHVDHVWPLSKGGVHHWCNLQIITAKQNIAKRAKHDGKSGVSFEDYMGVVEWQVF